MVDGDQLGKAFNVKAFHSCQVGYLLKRQLIPEQDEDPNPPLPFLPTVTGDNNFTLSTSGESVPLGSLSSSSSSSSSLSSDDAFLQEFDVESSESESVRPAQVGVCCSYTTELD